MSEELIAKWLDDRRSLDETEAAELVRVLTADPALRQNLVELLSLDDLLSRRLSVDRRNFENQVAQRIVGSGSEGSFLKSTLDAVEQRSRRRPWKSWLPEAAAAAVLVVGLLLLLLRKEAPPPQPVQPTPAVSKPQFRGLRAQYYRTQTLQGAAVDRVDATPDFTWSAGKPPIATSKDVYSARWTGKLTPTQSGRYALHARYDDGIRVWLDGKPVIDDWKGRYVIVDKQVQVDLEAGRLYDLKIEYFNGGDRGVMQLYWTAPGGAEEILPESVLSHE